MRILVASDRIGALSSRRAAELIASGWPTADTRVAPVGVSGRGFVEAYAAAFGGRLETTADDAGISTVAETASGSALCWEPGVVPSDPIPVAETSAELGRVLRRLLERRPRAVYVDLAGPVVHDAGAGALAALGAIADAALDQGVDPLTDLGQVDLGPARHLLGDTEVVGVVPEGELATLLTGLRGITSRRSRGSGVDPARMLAVDAALERFSVLAAAEVASAPGSGACGGLGFAVLALGGRLMTGPSVTLDTVPRDWRPDLVLTGCSIFDFARRGGGVVAEAARFATEVLAPCVVLAGEAYVGAREMRAMGIEAAYAVHAAGDVHSSGGSSPEADELARLAARVARSWSW